MNYKYGLNFSQKNRIRRLHKGGLPEHQIAAQVRTTEELVKKVLATNPQSRARREKEQPKNAPETVNKYT